MYGMPTIRPDCLSSTSLASAVHLLVFQFENTSMSAGWNPEGVAIMLRCRHRREYGGCDGLY